MNPPKAVSEKLKLTKHARFCVAALGFQCGCGFAGEIARYADKSAGKSALEQGT